MWRTCRSAAGVFGCSKARGPLVEVERDRASLQERGSLKKIRIDRIHHSDLILSYYLEEGKLRVGGRVPVEGIMREGTTT